MRFPVFRFMLALSTTTLAATLPSGFTETLVGSGITSGTTMQFSPDGRLFVAQQTGQLRVIKNDALLPTPFVTVNVDSVGERGLLGIAFDPNFAANQYVYIYYTVNASPRRNRVSRFTANGDIAMAGSETIILELDNLTAATNHNGGAMEFGPDGKLYIAVGENATSSNAQALGNLLGKMLRINADGTIPLDNPFYNSATGKNRAIWALGLRNPYNFDFQPGTARIFINDVGQNTWEEINEGVAGANYGWPTTEGTTTDPRFRSPIFVYGHGSGPTTGCAITGSAFYNPATVQFPTSYVNQYFFADYCSGWIRRYDYSTGTAAPFAGGISLPVDVRIAADGSLYYLARGSNSVYKVTYTGNQAPQITSQPASVTVTAGQPATFTVAASGAAPLTYQWQRNGVNITGATSAGYTIASTSTGDNGAQFRAVVTNQFGNATSNAATLTVTTNRAPTATITSPAAGALYAGGDTVAYAGTGNDPDDGALGGSAFTWRVDFHHDTHFHPFIPSTSGSTGGTFVIPRTGETSANVYYRIHLTVQDSGGLTNSVFRDILPRKVNLTLSTNPAGLQVALDGQPVTSPVTVQSVVGVQRGIGAPSPQSLSGATYQFSSWSDGGAAAHTIVTPAANTTYTATFQVSGGGGAVNLLSNPGFENGGQNWQYITAAGRSVTTAQAHSGSASAQMVASSRYERELEQSVPAAPGNVYDVSAWGQTNGISAGVSVRAVWLDSSSATLRTDILGTLTGTTAWTRIGGSLTAPTGAARVMIRLFMPVEPDNAGTAWFDDAAVVGQPQPVGLTNGGFEAGATGWLDTSAAGRAIVTTQAHSGTRSQQMTASNRYQREVEQNVSITAGMAYVASGWIMTSNLSAGARINLRWRNASGGVIRVDSMGNIVGTQPWTFLTGTVAAPAGAVTVTFEPNLAVEPDGAGMAWFDDLTFQ